MNRQHNTRQSQQGAVSIFIVIFSALAIVVLAVGFIRTMVQDQQQASNADLSQSAYDAALAGVEDGKRALLYYQKKCAEGEAIECARVAAAFASGNCSTLQTVAMNGGLPGVNFAQTPGRGLENLIQTNVSAASSQTFDQAYTCVKMSLDTPDYLGRLSAGQSQVVPLQGSAAFSKVKLEWFTTKDSGTDALELPGGGTVQLPAVGEATWKSNRPALARAQLMQYANGSFDLGQFDRAEDSNAYTLFLYPSRTGLNNAADLRFVDDNRRPDTSTNTNPALVKCDETIINGQYACSAVIEVPDPVGGTAANRTAWLRLSALYNNMEYRISLYDGGDQLVPFHLVQPSIDSTGRASDQFRRVESRVELGAQFPYPEHAVDLTGSLCKDFIVTDNPANFSSSAATATCKP